MKEKSEIGFFFNRKLYSKWVCTTIENSRVCEGTNCENSEEKNRWTNEKRHFWGIIYEKALLPNETMSKIVL